MRTSLLLISVLSAVLGSQPASAQGSCTEQKASDDAVRAVRQNSHVDFPLRATLQPSLSDDVIFLKTKGAAAPHGTVPVITFYSVALAPYQLTGNELEGQTVETDNHSQWLVAVDQESNHSFLLQGSTNPVDEFNRLIRSLRLRVTDADAALEVFDFFLKTVRGEQVRSRVVGDDMKLQSVALDDFRLRLPAAKNRAAFDAWWKGIPAAKRAAIKPPQARATESGFAVQYLLYDQGSLRKETLNVNADGTIAEASQNAQSTLSKPSN